MPNLIGIETLEDTLKSGKWRGTGGEKFLKQEDGKTAIYREKINILKNWKNANEVFV